MGVPIYPFVRLCPSCYGHFRISLFSLGLSLLGHFYSLEVVAMDSYRFQSNRVKKVIGLVGQRVTVEGKVQDKK